jgi:hypothetical protein
MLVVTGMTYLLGVLQVPPSSSAARAITAVMAGPSSSGFGGAEPPAKKAHPRSFLPVSSRYACDDVCWFIPFLPLLLMFEHRR